MREKYWLKEKSDDWHITLFNQWYCNKEKSKSISIYAKGGIVSFNARQCHNSTRDMRQLTYFETLSNHVNIHNCMLK